MCVLVYNKLMVQIDKLEGKNIDLILTDFFNDETKSWFVPAFLYKIVLHNTNIAVGSCDARIGYSENLFYGGNLGFFIKESYRGNGYAVEAVRLLEKVFKDNGMKEVYITNSPDNNSSIRVCEKVGAKFIKLVEVPEEHEIRKEGGEVYKNIWLLKV